MTAARYWRREAVCVPGAGVHLGCEHAEVLPADPPNVMPRPRRMCKRELHDLSDPANRVAGKSGCAPCKNTYQANLRRNLPAGEIRAPRVGDPVYAGPSALTPWQLAELRLIAACRSCGATPEDCADGRVRIFHALACRGNIDSVDRRGRPRRTRRSSG